MDILPAIDLRSGKCVRLLQGDYARQIDYGDDPVAQAQAFQDAGAKWLHVVDLDGALHGRMHNQAVIARILAATDLQVQVGGGIRREETVSQLLQLGVRQVVIGTRALEDMEWFEQIARTYSRQIVLGLDARQGKVATRGWKQESDITVQQMSKSVSDWPLAAIVYTDIACDGMLNTADILINRHPIFGFLFIKKLLFKFWAAETQEIPRRIKECSHCICFTLGFAFTFRTFCLNKIFSLR